MSICRGSAFHLPHGCRVRRLRSCRAASCPRTRIGTTTAAPMMMRIANCFTIIPLQPGFPSASGYYHAGSGMGSRLLGHETGFYLPGASVLDVRSCPGGAAMFSKNRDVSRRRFLSGVAGATAAGLAVASASGSARLSGARNPSQTSFSQGSAGGIQVRVDDSRITVETATLSATIDKGSSLL